LVFILLSLITAAITACSNSSSSEPSPQLPDVVGQGSNDPLFNRASCKYKTSEGKTAQLANLKRKDLKTAAFEKEYNHALLEGVLDTSIDETIGFILTAGVAIYKTGSRSVDSCKNYGRMPAPPADIANRWNEATKNDGKVVNGKSTGYVLAFYQPQDRDSAQATTRSQAVIVIRQDNDRYTLVHEFMHHLFYVSATEHGVTDSALRKNLNMAASLFDQAEGALKAMPTDDTKIAAAKAFATLLQRFDELLLHFTLEEMAIEDVLRQEKEAGSYQFISDFGRVNGSVYVSSSAMTALSYYQSFQEDGAKLKGLVGDQAQAVEILAQVEQKIQLRMNDIYAVKARNLEMGREQIRDLIGFYQTPAIMEVPTKPCARDQETEKIFSSLQKTLGKL
jgi:vacuolar-type H+-ATPase subunit F/Vma7